MQYRFLSVATICAIVISFFMAIYALIMKSSVDFYINIAYILISVGLYFDLKFNSNEKRSSLLFLLFFFIILVILELRMDPSSFGHLLLMVFPLLSYILMGRKKGTIWAIFYTIIMLILNLVVHETLSAWSILFFVLTSAMVSMICAIYERTGEMVISELEKTVTELEIQKQKISDIAIHDELTGLFNRRWFNIQFPKEIHRNRRQGTALGYFILDVDYFKQYNDNYGHLAGDIALKQVSTILQEELRRAGDMIFRLGGEEFGGIAHAEGQERLIGKVEIICRAVEQAQIPHAFQKKPGDFLTVSVGLVICDSPEDSRTEDELYKCADEALYRAKEEGRNRVCVAE